MPPKPRARLTKKAVRQSKGNWQYARNFNRCLERLGRRRVQTIQVAGDYWRSKIAWKIAAFREGVLYRTVMLAEGYAASWNTGNVLTAVLAARALSETVALLHDFKEQLDRYLAAKDLSALNDLVDGSTFASRLEDWISEEAGLRAPSIMKSIDRIEKLLPGYRRHYELLSEMCHPNALGHHQMFCSIDHETGAVSMSETTHLRLGSFRRSS